MRRIQLRAQAILDYRHALARARDFLMQFVQCVVCEKVASDQAANKATMGECDDNQRRDAVAKL